MSVFSSMPVSAELAQHHARQHLCPGAKLGQVICPCGDSAVWLCSLCGDVLFLVVAEGTWCAHAQSAHDVLSEMSGSR